MDNILLICTQTRCGSQEMSTQNQDMVSNTDVLTKAGILTLLRQQRLRWLEHVRLMYDGRDPKDLVYVELATESRVTGCQHSRFKVVRMRNMTDTNISPYTCDAIADNMNL